VPSSNCRTSSPIPPCSCFGDGPASAVPVGGCAPVTGCRRSPQLTAFGRMVWVLRWLLGRGCLRASPRTPAAGGTSRQGSGARACSIFQAPPGAGVRPAGAVTGLARIIALVGAGLRPQRRPIQSLADRIAGRFQRGGGCCCPWPRLGFWWHGAPGCGPRCWPPPPQVMAAGCWAAVARAVAGTPFSLALQLAIAVSWWLPLCLGPWHTPTRLTRGIAGLAARSGLLFRGGDAIEIASRLQTVLFDQNRHLTQGRSER